MAQELTELQSVWDQHAKADPLWAILSVPDKKGKEWKLEDFLLTGVQDIAHVLKVIEESGTPLHYGIAIDFGYGVGRLTQPLAARFERAIGIDISPTLIYAVLLINRYGNKAQYILNSVDDLPVIPDRSADLAFSHVVLRHIRPARAEHYIRDPPAALRAEPRTIQIELNSEFQELEVDGSAAPVNVSTAQGLN